MVSGVTRHGASGYCPVSVRHGIEFAIGSPQVSSHNGGLTRTQDAPSRRSRRPTAARTPPHAPALSIRAMGNADGGRDARRIWQVESDE